MRALVIWGSKHGGTEGIAEAIADVLAKHGHDVVAVSARDAPSPHGFDAAIIGGSLYANRWHRDARRYVDQHLAALRRIPTWLFSSGPLDESADRGETSPTRELRALVARTGAVEHVMFGGRLDEAATGFIASRMAKDHGGDWRNPARIDAWAEALAHDLPNARPRPYEELHGHMVHRIVEYGAVAWAASAAPLLAHSLIVSTILAVIVFAGLAHRYQAETGARSAFAVAAAWAIFAGVLDAIFFRTYAAAVPVGFGFAAAWAVGAITAMTPTAKPNEASAYRAGPP